MTGSLAEFFSDFVKERFELPLSYDLVLDAARTRSASRSNPHRMSVASVANQMRVATVQRV